MKWRSAQKKQKELRVLSWQQALPDIAQPLDVRALAELELKIQGKIVLPTDPDYHSARQLSNFAFQDFPLLIAYCEIVADVRSCLKFARDRNLPVVIRSGGHSTAGFSISSGMVIDLSRLSYVVVNAEKKEAIVGAGTRFGRLFHELDIYNLHVPGGGCHDVCVAGFMQGGGFGYTSRMFGMNCDNVLEALVLLANGGVVVANKTTNSDLFWALRGGTGGNFGILLQVTYKLYKLEELWGFRYTWTIDSDCGKTQAGEVLALLQAKYMAGSHAPELGYQAFLGWQLDKPCLVVRGMFAGPADQGKELLEPLRKISTPQISERTGSYLDMDEFIHEKPDIPQVDDLAREEKQSGYIARPLHPDDWRKVIDMFLKTPTPWSLIGIEAYGGAINAPPEDATAFVHRKVSLDLYLDVFWMTDEQRGPAVKFLDDFMDFMEKNYFNGASYQNYPRLSQQDYRYRYWRGYFSWLQCIKTKYDPTTLFRYPQAVLPEPQSTAAAAKDKSASISAALDRPIVYVLPPE